MVGACGDDSSNNQTGGACSVDTDCAASTECASTTCMNHACVTTFQLAGAAAAQQTPGDCKAAQCDGNGNVVDVNDDSDVPAATDCVSFTCSSGSAQPAPLPIGTACGAGSALMCDGGGDCVNCTLPDQCPGSDSDCQVRTCLEGVCGVDNQPMNMAAAHQVTGDCHKNLCDGSGNVVSTIDNTDAPNDNNACTANVCTNGSGSNPPLGSGTSCGSGLQCDGTGDCVTCIDASQCPGSDTECETRTCTSGTCGFSFTGSGTLVSEQTAGDCNDAVCDGAGNITNTPDDGDLPNDHNDCTADTCTNGSAGHSNEPQGSACAGGLECDGAGNCGFCGDGVAINPEQCDGSDLAGATCASDGFTAGSLACDTATCQFDTSACTLCGNGTIESGEACDGSNFGGATCASEGFDSGTLSCTTPGCQVDTSTCGTCGNGVVDGDEVCDPGNGADLGPSFGSASCVSLGHAPGTLACSSDCNSIDVRACDGGFVSAQIGSDTSQLTGTVCIAGLAIPLSNGAPNVGVCTSDNGVWRLGMSETSAGAFVTVAGVATWLKADGSGSTATGPAVQNQTAGTAGINSVTSDLGRGIILQDAGASYDYFTRDLGNGTGLPSGGPFLAPFPAWNSFRSAASPFNQATPVWSIGPGFSSWGEQVFTMKWGGGGSNPIHYVGGWDSGKGQAFVRWGASISRDCGPPLNPAANNCSTKVDLGDATGQTVTGTVTGMASGVTSLTAQHAFDLHVMVFGQTNIDGADGTFPVDGDAVGGVFWSPDQGLHFVEDDTGIGADNNDCATSSDGTGFANDKNLVFTGVADYSTFSTSQAVPRNDPGGAGSPYPVANLKTFAATMYVGLRGGGSLYKTTNGGASWCRANRGLPRNVEVFQIVIDCYAAAVGNSCQDPSLLFAATSQGLYKSNDGGASWALAGLEGEVVHAVSIELAHPSGVTPYILTATDQPGDIRQRIIQDAP
nr:hypothetical protein [Kofleriaceae bacterium]